MICDKCGLPLLGTESFCPQCGADVRKRAEPGWLEPAAAASSEDTEAAAPEAPAPPSEPQVIEAVDVPIQARPSGETTRPPAAEAAPRPGTPGRRPAQAQLKPKAAGPNTTERLRARLVGPMGLGMLAGLLVFVILGIGILAVYQGLQLRGGRQADDAAKAYAQGVGYMDQGNYELAIGAFEYALRLRPSYSEAQKKLDEARSKAKALPTPTTVSQGPPSTLLAEGRAAYDNGAWGDAIAKLEALQAADPAYEQANVRRLLVSAYMNEGMRLANEDRMEEAIRRFDQALALQPDNADVQAQRRLATLYQSGLSAWDADWPKAIQDLSTLYTLKPTYKDTAQRLQRAYVLAGDAAGTKSQWCDAAQYYQTALTMSSTPELASKREEAARLCASPNSANGAAPSGTFVGTLVGQDAIQADWGKVHGHVLDAQGKAAGGVKVKLSAYDWSAYTNTDSNGYYVFEALSNDITFTVTLVSVPSQPLDVAVKRGMASTADFKAKP